MSVANLRIRQSLDTIANATELTSRVIKNFTGNDIANSLNNNPLTNDALRTLVISRIQHNVSKMETSKV